MLLNIIMLYSIMYVLIFIIHYVDKAHSFQ